MEVLCVVGLVFGFSNEARGSSIFLNGGMKAKKFPLAYEDFLGTIF
jgi:hypothetical protein